MMARTWVPLAAALSVALSIAPPAEAQVAGAARAPATSDRIPRRILYAGFGALVGVAASSLYMLGGNLKSGGACSTSACVVPISTVTSSLVGYMVGREKDQLHAIRYRSGRPLSPGVVSASLEGEPTVLTVTDTTVAAAGLGGVQLFGARGDRMRAIGRRAAGVRGIGALAIAPASGSIAIGAASGLYVYPPGTGPGSLVRDGDVGAAAAVGDRVYYAVGTRVERAPFDADTTRTWPGIELGHKVNSLTFDGARGLLWAIADSSLYALRPEGDSLSLVSTTTFDAAARRADVADTRLAIAFGEGGVRTYDATDPKALRELSRWTGARFVYDVSFAGPRLFAAAGIEGVYVLDASSSPLTVLGLARELGYAIEVESGGGFTYILDRSDAAALRRIKSNF